MEQWHLARAQTPHESAPSSSDTLRQVVTSCLKGMYCSGSNKLHWSNHELQCVTYCMCGNVPNTPPELIRDVSLRLNSEMFTVNLILHDVSYFYVGACLKSFMIPVINVPSQSLVLVCDGRSSVVARCVAKQINQRWNALLPWHAESHTLMACSAEGICPWFVTLNHLHHLFRHFDEVCTIFHWSKATLCTRCKLMYR